jgi:hypothetical protein
MVEFPAAKLAGFFMRFTIRDLLWLTVVVAMGCGWYADRTYCMSVIRQLNIALGTVRP